MEVNSGNRFIFRSFSYYITKYNVLLQNAKNIYYQIRQIFYYKIRQLSQITSVQCQRKDSILRLFL